MQLLWNWSGFIQLYDGNDDAALPPLTTSLSPLAVNMPNYSYNAIT